MSSDIYKEYRKYYVLIQTSNDVKKLLLIDSVIDANVYSESY